MASATCFFQALLFRVRRVDARLRVTQPFRAAHRHSLWKGRPGLLTCFGRARPAVQSVGCCNAEQRLLDQGTKGDSRSHNRGAALAGCNVTIRAARKRRCAAPRRPLPRPTLSRR